MAVPEHEIDQIAAALRVSIGLLVSRLRQSQVGDLSMPERSALSRLDRSGPSTASALARLEQISPQSIGATLGALEETTRLERHSDPADGRLVVLSVTDHGRQVLADRRSARVEQLAQALTTGFSSAELRQLAVAAPLIERLAQSI
jgi:DNA-binding MarR family transcriptional regulator